MLFRGVNDADAAIEAAAAFVERLRPRTAYIAAPTRPPSEPWVVPASEEVFNVTVKLVALIWVAPSV
jgi:wyosine [tRNA(Phe)-imidazoG37] synthetase (radical SAM superfamily)